jgi:hypothetical protein
MLKLIKQLLQIGCQHTTDFHRQYILIDLSGRRVNYDGCIENEDEYSPGSKMQISTLNTHHYSNFYPFDQLPLYCLYIHRLGLKNTAEAEYIFRHLKNVVNFI